MYTKIWNDEVAEKLQKRMEIESAKGNTINVRECEEAIAGQYCPDCSMYDDASPGGTGVRCPLCGRMCEVD